LAVVAVSILDTALAAGERGFTMRGKPAMRSQQQSVTTDTDYV
jgi:hypothetical protein